MNVRGSLQSSFVLGAASRFGNVGESHIKIPGFFSLAYVPEQGSMANNSGEPSLYLFSPNVSPTLARCKQRLFD